jgi:hypothetical protein
MTNFVPLEKQSKKAQRAYHAQQRNIWGINPVTRKTESKKAFSKAQRSRNNAALAKCFG